MSPHSLVRLIRYVLVSVVILPSWAARWSCALSPHQLPWDGHLSFGEMQGCSLLQHTPAYSDSDFSSPIHPSLNLAMAAVSCFFRELTHLHKVKREREGRPFGSFLLWVFWVEQHCRMKLKLPSQREPMIPITTGNSFFKLRAPEEKNIRESEQLHCCFVLFISACSS